MHERDANLGTTGDEAPAAPGRAPRERTRVGWLLAAAGVAVLAAIGFEGLVRWIAVAAMVTIGPDLVRLIPNGVAARLVRAAPVLLVVAIASFTLWELVLGRAPATRDHGVHYLQASILVDQMLPSGRLWGWTDRLNNGVPFGESYPVLGHLWVAAGHLLTMGALDLRTSYAWGLLSIWAAGIASVWWLSTTLAREVGSASSSVAWAGCIGALLWLLDPGGSRQGGWSYLMFHGVWPQMLSTTLWTLSLVLTWRALTAASPRRLALAGACLGASVLAHPFGLLTAVTSAGGWLVVLTVTPAGRTVASGRFRLWLIVHLVAAGLAAGWMTVFFGSAESMGRSPVSWAPLGELTTALVTGQLFEGQSPWSGILALLGVIVVVRRGGAMSWLVLGLVVGMLVLGSHAAITILRVDLIVAGFENLQFPRYAIAVKPLLFALGGVGALVIAGGLRRWIGEPIEAPRSRQLRFIAALILAPVLASMVEDGGRLFARPIGAIDTLENSGQAEHEAALLETLRSEGEAPSTDLRIAFLRMHMGGGTYPLFTIADAGAGVVLDGHVATINFEHRFGPRTPEALAALGVTHVLRDRELGEDESQLAEALEAVGRFGAYTLERLRFDRIARHPVTAARPDIGLRVIEETPESLVVDVTEASRRTALTLLRAPHVRWRATFDGSPVEIHEDRLHTGLAVMKVRVPGSGRLLLRYERSRRETTAARLAMAMLVLVLLALAFPKRLELADRLVAPAAQRASALMAGLAVALVLMWVARREASRLEETWTDVVQRATSRRAGDERVFVRDLVVDGDLETTRAPDRVCVGLMGKDVLLGCSEAAHRSSTAFVFDRPHLYRCLAVTVPAHGHADVRLGSAQEVVGIVARLAPGHARHLTWTPHGAKEKAKRRMVSAKPDAFHLEDEAFQDGIALRLRNRGGSPERVCVAAAEVRTKATGASGARLD